MPTEKLKIVSTAGNHFYQVAHMIIQLKDLRNQPRWEIDNIFHASSESNGSLGGLAGGAW